MGEKCGVEKLEDTSALLGAGCQHRPRAFAPAHPRGATRALGHSPVDHHMTDRLFGQLFVGVTPGWVRKVK
jgi:hypothetical protein